jgi:hypothetical protein
MPPTDPRQIPPTETAYRPFAKSPLQTAYSCLLTEPPTDRLQIFRLQLPTVPTYRRVCACVRMCVCVPVCARKKIYIYNIRRRAVCPYRSCAEPASRSDISSREPWSRQKSLVIALSRGALSRIPPSREKAKKRRKNEPCAVARRL